VGLVAAVHFGAYIASLNFTTIAHSLALVYTAPVFSALLSWWILGEKLRPRQWLGVVIAVLGVAIMAGFEPQFDSRMLIGDALALLSAVTFAIYSIAGRGQRHQMSLLVYAGAVYLVGGVWLTPLAALNFSAGGYTLLAIVSIVALAVIPLGLGHTLYNAALRRMRATSVNLIATQEVTGGIILGILLLGEVPSLITLGGIAVTLVGIILVLVER
jgi:drug/metabolite transporter (DMT)-like permease